MCGPRVALFAYNFPHKKTQDFMFRAFVEDLGVACVIAADPVELNIPPSAIRTKLSHLGLVHPSKVAERLGMEYVVLPHDSEATAELLSSRQFDIGIVAGARIIKAHIIEKFSIGIINFHPGLIPEARGLDALLWSIYGNQPLGVTAHLIDRRVDAGRVLLRRPIAIRADDTLLDLSERLYDQQLDMLSPAVQQALSSEWTPVDPRSPHNPKMPPDLELRVRDKLLVEYVRAHATK